MSFGTIIYIGGFELPDKDAAAHRVLNNAKVLRELGYDVVFIDVNRGTKAKKILDYKNIQGFNVWTRKFPDSIAGWLEYLISISAVKKVINKYNNVKAVICYNYQSVSLYNLIKYCKKKNIKIIADCTEWYEDNRLIKKLDTEFRMQFLHKRVDGIICISKYLESYYSKYVNTVVIPPLVDSEETKWKFKVQKVNDGKIHFVYSGSPGKHKDKLNYIIKAFNNIIKELTNFKFTIIGLTKEQYLRLYPEHINIINNMDECINFKGRISHEQSLKHVKAADFQIFIRENKRVNNAGFPTKFVESMACGTPVITTKTSDLDNYLLIGENGYFIDSEDNREFENTLQTIIKMKPNQISEMKKYCGNYTVFSYKNFVRPLESFLENVIKKR
ncbi:glycosyltransferase [Cytobacillus firmus]|uniref:Glycosyltransferase n=1 Tax=Cytobacillus firmus TaxID=1399 RepID=A0AA46SCY8_CYTFI|nr:glycosyltransferase [Cytobacillus firmus]UYG93833.1 glycosyltransferase [Cytobacillus firmus]